MMATVGTTWICERSVVVVVRDCGFGGGQDTRRYSEVLILQQDDDRHGDPHVGKLGICVDLAKHWTRLEA